MRIGLVLGIAAALAIGAAAVVAAPERTRPASFHSIVDASALLFGASGGGQWYGDEEASKWFQSGEAYTFYSMTRRLDSEAGIKLENDEHCGATVVMQPNRTENAAMGIVATWNALPRVPRAVSTDQPVYARAVRDVLVSRGFHKPVVHVDQVVRVDLDGKGVESVLVAASKLTPDGRFYSVVLLRQPTAKGVRTIVLDSEIDNKNTSKGGVVLCRFAIAGTFDFQGDGRMAPMLTWQGIDAAGSEIMDVRNGGAQRVLYTACGA